MLVVSRGCVAREWLPWPAWLTRSSRSDPASSSSAAASSGLRWPTTSRTWAGGRAARARPAHLGHHVARGRARWSRSARRRRRRPRCASTRPTSTRGSRPRPVRRPASSRSASSRSRATTTGSRSTDASRRSTATAASTSTRSPRARSARLFPLARTDDLLAGFYVNEDGRANPVDVTMALAKGARLAGRDGHRGRARHRRPDRPGVRSRGVRTPHGDIEAESSSTARACGRASSARGPASTSRCRRPSTTT